MKKLFLAVGLALFLIPTLAGAATNLQVVGLDSVVQEVIATLEPDIAGRKIDWKNS